MKTVFTLLAERKREQFQREILNRKSGKKYYPERTVEIIFGELDIIIEQIKEEFLKKEGAITSLEKEFCLEYLSKFYFEYSIYANLCREVAYRESNDNESFRVNIQRAWDSTMRATSALKVSKLIGYDEKYFCGSSYASSMDKLSFFRNELRVMREFPNCYKDILRMTEDLRIFVVKEDYENAAKIKGKIQERIQVE